LVPHLRSTGGQATRPFDASKSTVVVTHLPSTDIRIMDDYTEFKYRPLSARKLAVRPSTPPAGASATPSALQAVTLVGTDRLTGICPLADHSRFTEDALLAVYCLAQLALSSPIAKTESFEL
jgi:hypothetical protein